MIRKHRIAKTSKQEMMSITIRMSQPSIVASCDVVATTPVVTRANTSMVSSSMSESSL